MTSLSPPVWVWADQTRLAGLWCLVVTTYNTRPQRHHLDGASSQGRPHPHACLARNTQQRGTEYEEQQAMISDRGPHRRQEGKHMMRLSLTSLHLLVCPVTTLLTLCLPTQHVDPSFPVFTLAPLIYCTACHHYHHKHRHWTVQTNPQIQVMWTALYHKGHTHFTNQHMKYWFGTLLHTRHGHGHWGQMDTDTRSWRIHVQTKPHATPYHYKLRADSSGVSIPLIWDLAVDAHTPKQ